MMQEPSAVTSTQTAAEFTRQLWTFQSDDELPKILRYFKSDGGDGVFMGVRMLHIFDLAKTFAGTASAEIEKLLTLRCTKFEPAH